MNHTTLPKLKRSLIIKRSKLLDMDYKPEEIAEVFGVSADYIRKHIIGTLQAPHRRSGSGRIFINGKNGSVSG